MLTIENLSLYYANNNKVLDNISMQIEDGATVLLTGESGSGKSSIINSINGLALEYENAKITGNIKIDGKNIQDLELYEISKLISSVFQNPKTYFFNVDTTLELLFFLENIGLSREEMKNRLDDMLTIFPIEHLLSRNIFELSGGEKQILCIASCYISGCKIIVLDEPSSNLDDKYIDILKDMLKILKDKKVTLIFAEHRIYYLMDIVDNIFIIKEGKIYKSFKRNDFLSLTDQELEKYGLRSNKKTNLKKSEKISGKDLFIKKIVIPFKDKRILDIENVSFDLGNIYGIIGKNGSGKSTFLKSITGLLEKDKNEIFFKEKKISNKERLKNSSLVMQDVNHQLFSNSLEEEMKLGLKDIEEEQINSILSDLGLLDLKERHPMSLSGGQKQRVAIASVLCKNSKFIFFDEPTSGMDYNNMVKISKLIKKIKNKDNIIFIVSHDTEFLNVTADYIFCLENFLITNK